MPIQVPRYDQPQVQEQGAPQVRQQVQVSDEAFGGGQSQERLNQATQGFAKVIEEEKRKADEVVLTDYNTKLTRLKNDLVYNKDNGLVTKRGKDAFGAKDDLQARYQAQVEELDKGLSSPEQRAMAARMKEGHWTDLDSDIGRHVSKESMQLDEDTTKAAIQASADDAIMNYRNPEKVTAALEAQRGHVMRWAARNGLPEEVVKQRLEDVTNKTHAGVIDRMLANGDDLAADQYYKANSEQITGPEKIALEKVLEEGSLRGESQRQSDAIMKQGLSMSQALARAKEVENPKLRDAITDRIKQDFAQKDAADRDMREKLHVRAGNIIDQTAGDLTKIPPREWEKFSVSEKAALKSYAAHKREGTQPSTNWENFYELKTLASVPQSRDQFLKTNLMEYRPKMADAEFKQLVDLQTSLRNGDGKAASHLDGFRSDMDIVNSALSDAGINHNAKPGTDEAKSVSLFKAKVDQEVIKYQERTGKKITNDELKRITDNHMVEGFTDQGIFGTGVWRGKKRIFEIDSDTKQFVIEAKSIPSAERSLIEDALKRRGIQVTDAAVLKLYKTKIGGISGN